MSQVWTRDKWNEIIQQINDLSENPPEGYSALPSLEEVPENHKWSVADIEAVRDRLLAICTANIFSAELVKWTQDIIDEIETAIANGWCGGETVIYMDWIPDSTTLNPDNYPYPRYSKNYYGHCPEDDYGGPTYWDASETPANAFNGMQVAPASESDRTWEARLIYYSMGGEPIEDSFIAIGWIDHDGVIRDAQNNPYQHVLVAGAYAYFQCRTAHGGFPFSPSSARVKLILR
jgi:hypothetical protein